MSYVVVLDDTGRSENEKMSMTVLIPLCPGAFAIAQVSSRQDGHYVQCVCEASCTRLIHTTYNYKLNSTLDLSIVYSIYSKTSVSNRSFKHL